MFGAPMIWNDGDAGGWCPFAGPRCPWPCPPNCQCPGERPMDVAESEDAVQFGAVDATDCGHPFPGAPQSWPWCSSSCRQCPGGCAMDVHGSDATITGRDAPGHGQLASADQQFSSWPYGVTNGVHRAQWSDDGPTYGDAVDDDMCLVGATTDDDSGNEPDSSGGVIIIV